MEKKKRNYCVKFQYSECEILNEGEFTTVKRVPKGDIHETTLYGWDGKCDIKKAQEFLDKSYPLAYAIVNSVKLCK